MFVSSIGALIEDIQANSVLQRRSLLVLEYGITANLCASYRVLSVTLIYWRSLGNCFKIKKKKQENGGVKLFASLVFQL